MVKFENIDIINLIVVVGLVITLLLSIFYGKDELSTNISVGLLGFLGGIVKDKKGA